MRNEHMTRACLWHGKDKLASYRAHKLTRTRPHIPLHIGTHLLLLWEHRSGPDLRALLTHQQTSVVPHVPHGVSFHTY